METRSPDPDEIISVSVAADLKGVTREAVYQAMKQGRLPHRKSGHTFLIRRGDLDRWTVVGGSRPRPKKSS